MQEATFELLKALKYPTQIWLFHPLWWVLTAAWVPLELQKVIRKEDLARSCCGKQCMGDDHYNLWGSPSTDWHQSWWTNGDDIKAGQYTLQRSVLTEIFQNTLHCTSHGRDGFLPLPRIQCEQCIQKNQRKTIQMQSKHPRNATPSGPPLWIIGYPWYSGRCQRCIENGLRFTCRSLRIQLASRIRSKHYECCIVLQN